MGHLIGSDLILNCKTVFRIAAVITLHFLNSDGPMVYFERQSYAPLLSYLFKETILSFILYWYELKPASFFSLKVEQRLCGSYWVVENEN